MSYATAQLRLTLEQVAELIRELTDEQKAVLEEMLDADTTAEVLRRSADPHKKFLSHGELRHQIAL